MATMRVARSCSTPPVCMVSGTHPDPPALTPPGAVRTMPKVRLPRVFGVLAVAAVVLVTAMDAGAASPTFARAQNGPVLTPTKGFYDDYMIASPTVVNVGGTLFMIYAGHCQKPAGYTPLLPPRMTCPGDSGIFLLGATSTDGRHWTKRATPVLSADQRRPWMRNGVAEAELVAGPDGWFYLFFTGLGRHDGRSIGVARSRAPFGPWDVDPQPLLRGAKSALSSTHKVLAPAVSIEPTHGQVMLWYNGTNRPEIGWDVYVATAPWPLRTASGWRTATPVNHGNRAVVGPYDAGSGDPSVLVVGGRYEMFFTCGSPKTNGPPAICLASSADGMTFTVPTHPEVQMPRSRHWDENLETAFVLHNPNGCGLWMYYAGYRNTGYANTSLGFATSPSELGGRCPLRPN